MGPLTGSTRVPGDKSTTHRALILGALAEGETTIDGGAAGADVAATARALAALGAEVRPGAVVGRGRLVPTDATLDCGNSGTTARLLIGALAGTPGRSALDGDASLRARPMDRVAAPLRAAGARIDGDRLPLVVEGAPLAGREHVVDVPSAQVKGALLIAGLAAEGETTVVQHVATRDHTERLLPRFGADVRVEPGRVVVRPGALRPARVDVPGDPSSAAFLVVAALLVPGSRLVLRDVGLWPRRTGFLRALLRAGAPIEVVARRRDGGPVSLGGTAMTEGGADDPRGDLSVEHAPLEAFEVAPEDVPDLVDEIPVLALAAAVARGTSRFAGLAELRLKESDRVRGTAELLRSLGVEVETRGDELLVTGAPRFSAPPAVPFPDHRLALTAAVAALVAPDGAPPDLASAAVSFPDLPRVLAGLAGEA